MLLFTRPSSQPEYTLAEIEKNSGFGPPSPRNKRNNKKRNKNKRPRSRKDALPPETADPTRRSARLANGPVSVICTEGGDWRGSGGGDDDDDEDEEEEEEEEEEWMSDDRSVLKYVRGQCLPPRGGRKRKQASSVGVGFADGVENQQPNKRPKTLVS